MTGIINKLAYCLALWLLLSGCVSINKLKKQYSHKKEYTTELDFQLVYKIISSNLKKCHQEFKPPVGFGINYKSFNDKRKAEIAFFLTSQKWITDYYFLIEIYEEEKSTKIVAYGWRDKRDIHFERIGTWLKGDESVPCHWGSGL